MESTVNRPGMVARVVSSICNTTVIASLAISPLDSCRIVLVVLSIIVFNLNFIAINVCIIVQYYIAEEAGFRCREVQK